VENAMLCFQKSNKLSAKIPNKDPIRIDPLKNDPQLKINPSKIFSIKY